MPILTGDIKLVASQVMDDVPEGGGAPTATAIVDGTSNAIVPDVSELDRAGGRVNLRKLFVSVQTDDVATYMGSNVIVAEPPTDPNISLTLFTTNSVFDTRGEDDLVFGSGAGCRGRMRVLAWPRPWSALPGVAC